MSESNIDAALLELPALTKQLLLQFYDYPTASELPDYVTTAQVKQDLHDVIDADCATLLLESDPKAVIDLWIS